MRSNSRLRLRICLVSRELAPFQAGGIGTYVELMARALADAGHDVHLLSQPRPNAASAQRDGRIHHHAVSLEAEEAGREAYAFFPQRYAMAVHVALRRLHRETPFDLIEFPEFFGEGYFALRARRYLGAYAGATLAVRLHTPSLHVRRLNEDGTVTGESALIEHLESESIRLADLLLSPTHSLLARVEAEQGPARRSAVVRHPFAPSWSADLGQAGSGGGPPRILYFGRLERRKGVHLLLEAFLGLAPRHPALELQLVGGDTPTGPSGGSMRAHLERRVPPGLKDRVRIEGSRDRGALNEAIASATLCCFPSLWENFPNVCLEAMAAGQAIVASASGGMGELLEDGKSGLLVPGGDLDALQAALERGLADAALRQSLGEGARARLTSLCDPASVVRALESELDGVCPPSVDTTAAARLGVSVVIPFFNLAHTLPETLASIRAQTLPPEEVLIVDDGSTDPESLALLASLEEEAGIRILRQANGGVSSARNRALREARGDWLLTLDPDDLVAPDFLEKAAGVVARETEVGYVTSLVSFFSEDPGAPVGGYVPWGLVPEVMLARNVSSGPVALIRRALVEAVGGYDERMTAYEDWDLFCALTERGVQGAVLPEFLTHYRIRPGSLIRTLDPDRRHWLRAHLIAKHPALATSRAVRLLLWEAEEATARQENPPLRHRLVDRVNQLARQVPALHAALKRLGR